MIEPFVPLYPWLRDALDDAQLVLAIAEPDEDDPRPALDARDVGDHLLDLRHGPTRYAVLRALHDVGHSRPWALGAPWSPLTDEQAGRAAAEILRAVGEDPSKPVGVVPICVLSPWLTDRHGQSLREPLGVALWPFVNDYGWYISEYRNGRHYRDVTGSSGPHATPDNTDDAGRLAADTAARALGCLMIEDLTPT